MLLTVIFNQCVMGWDVKVKGQRVYVSAFAVTLLSNIFNAMTVKKLRNRNFTCGQAALVATVSTKMVDGNLGEIAMLRACNDNRSFATCIDTVFVGVSSMMDGCSFRNEPFSALCVALCSLPDCASWATVIVDVYAGNLLKRPMRFTDNRKRMASTDECILLVVVGISVDGARLV